MALLYRKHSDSATTTPFTFYICYVKYCPAAQTQPRRLHLSTYRCHVEEESVLRRIIANIEQTNHQEREELETTARLHCRNKQLLDAQCILSGETVRVYAQGKLLGIIKNCEVSYCTALICFALVERNERGAIIKTVEVTPDMDVFVEARSGK
jgi:hypothetical protein